MTDYRWENFSPVFFTPPRLSHPNSTRLNHFITKKLAEANDKLLEFESGAEAITAHTSSLAISN